MAGTKKTAGLGARLSKAARVRTDRERALYVRMRRLTSPVTTLTRTRAAKASATRASFAIPEDLGYALFPKGQFPETTEVVEQARAALAASDGTEKANKDFMAPLLDPSSLTRKSPLVRFALRQDVLDAVTSYLGVAPVLSSLQVYHSKPAGRDEFVSSQLFHCDGDDTRQVKIFVLCSDVGLENGPLMVLSGEDSRRLRREVGYQYRRRIDDAEAERVLGSVDLEPIIGPSGTTCIVDTSSCFHYGSRVGAEAESRLVTIVQYLTPYSFMLPRDFREQAPFRHLATDESDSLERLVLGAA